MFVKLSRIYMKCRLCKGQVKKFLDLGQTPLPEEFRLKKDLKKPVTKYPLNLVSCVDCKHVQLGFIPPIDTIYKKNYFYDYSVTKRGKDHWYKLSKKIYKEYKLSKKDLVLDIGSNSGTLLSFFKQLGTKILGVDPATKLVQIARKKGVHTINDYFAIQVAKKIVKKHGRAKIITCNNTFDHVADLDIFMKGISIILANEGVFVIEVPYFLNMIKDLSHTPYHQQIDYLMIKPLIPFVSQFGLEITDLETIPMHGGSIRIFIYFKGTKKPTERFLQLIKEEEALLKNWNQVLENFAKSILKQRDSLKNFLKDIKVKHHKIAAVGASAKGINLLNYCNIGRETIKFITEKSPLKINRFTPSGIPIVSDEWLIKQKPDYALVLAWNFNDEIIKNLKQYKKSGGKFIIPIPKITVI